MTNQVTKQMTKQMAVRLPNALFERLKNLSDKTGRTATYYLREALNEHLDDMEDIYLAEQTLIHHHASGERNYSLEEIKDELGLAD